MSPPSPAATTSPEGPAAGSALPDKSRKQQKAQIFISYSRSDRLAVDQLARDLRKRHYALWMDVDEKGIEPGEEWVEELKKQISASEGMIACVSPDFLKSPYCRAEIEQAQREGKAIYPVIVRRLEAGQSMADMSLSHLQYVDLTQEYRQSLKRLMRVPAVYDGRNLYSPLAMREAGVHYESVGRPYGEGRA